MKAQDLKNSILQMAMEGKLVPQDPNDEPASVLLERIREEKEQLIKEKKIKRNNKESVIFRKNNHFYEKIGKKGEEVCIDDEIPWEIPESWEWVYLENILNITSSKRVHQSDWKTEGIPFYRAREIAKLADNGFVDNDLFISQELFDEFKKFGIPKPNDLMVTGVGTLGKTYIVKNKDCFYYKDASVLCFNNFGNLNPYFLKFLMQTSFMKNQIKSSSSGTTVATITMKKANKYLMPLPPLAEQKRIVNKLEDLIPYIEIYEGHEEKLEILNKDFPSKIKDSILQDAIQGKLVPQDPNDEPASVLLERIRNEKEQLIKEKKIKRNKNESFIFKENNHFYEKIGNEEPICIDNEIPFEIPKNWVWCRLGNIVYNFGQKKPDKTFSYIDVGSIDNKNLKLNDTETILSKEEAPSRARKIIKEGAVIYSTVRPYLLNMCIIDKKFSYEPIASTAFAILNPFNGLYNKYLFYYLQSPTFINYVNSMMSGVAYPAINDKKLYNSLIALPPLEEQKRIFEKIESLFQKI